MIWIVAAAIAIFLAATGMHLYKLNKVSEKLQDEIDPDKLKDYDDNNDDD